MTLQTPPAVLPGRTAVVTGAASGIGRATVAAFLAEGWRVAALDRDAALLDTLVAAFDGERLVTTAVDVTDADAVTRAVNDCDDEVAPIRALVASAGIGADVGFFETTPELMRRMYDVNVVGTFLVARAVAEIMRETGGGSIVTVASVSGLVGNLGRTAYGTSKGAVVNLTRIMAVELARHDIRVNCLAPGPIDTELARRVHTDTMRSRWLDVVPQHRYGTPEEVAQTAVFLADDSRSSYLTGQILAVDGGFAAAGLMEPAGRA